jgi:heat shock protein HslJ
VINLFSATPPQIQPGQCVNLQWAVTGSVKQIVLTRGGTSLWNGAPVSGTLQDCPPGAGTVGYTLQATGPGGTSTGQQNVNIVAPQPTATPVPPTAVPPTEAPPTAAPPTATTAPQPPAIVGKNWLLTAYNNGQGGLASPIAGTSVTALFGADDRVSGSDGCNNYNAPYTVSGKSLTVGPPAPTQMACPADIAQQGQTYLTLLQQSQSYDVSGNQLTIFGSGNQKLLQYVAQ